MFYLHFVKTRMESNMCACLSSIGKFLSLFIFWFCRSATYKKKFHLIILLYISVKNYIYSKFIVKRKMKKEGRGSFFFDKDWVKNCVWKVKIASCVTKFKSVVCHLLFMLNDIFWMIYYKIFFFKNFSSFFCTIKSVSTEFFYHLPFNLSENIENLI